MAGLVFCKVRHSEAIRRKHDSNHQDVAFLEGVLSPLAKKKGEAEAGALKHQDVTFFRRRFPAFDRRKGDAGAAALYTGVNVSALSCPYGKLTNHSDL